MYDRIVYAVVRVECLTCSVFNNCAVGVFELKSSDLLPDLSISHSCIYKFAFNYSGLKFGETMKAPEIYTNPREFQIQPMLVMLLFLPFQLY